MSDSEIRDAERTYRASGAPQDGEAYVQAVLRSTGLNSTFLIARVIEMRRAIAAIVDAPAIQLRAGLVDAIDRAVTPDDMVSFLRGGREWLNPSFTTVMMDATERALGFVNPPSIMHGRQGTAFVGAGGRIPSVDERLQHELSAFHQVWAGEQYSGCHFEGCYERATVHGALAEPMYCAQHAAGADPNDLLPRTRGVPAGSAILCNHANENPGHCPCEPDCYCRQDGHTCSDVDAVAFNNGPEPVCEAQPCPRSPGWRLKRGRRGYFCTEHLAALRRLQLPRANNSLSEIVRHHEAVDDV